MNGIDYKEIVNKRKGERDALLKLEREEGANYRTYRQNLRHAERAKAIIQEVAALTQAELQFRISDLVSLALASVFPNPYQFRVEFTPRRGKTEADLRFTRDGEVRKPLRQCGGGTIDIGALGLRLSFWALPEKRQRPIFLFDEPLKNINDKTREAHQKAADLIIELSKRMGIQFLIVTKIPELMDHEEAHGIEI